MMVMFDEEVRFNFLGGDADIWRCGDIRVWLISIRPLGRVISMLSVGCAGQRLVGKAGGDTERWQVETQARAWDRDYDSNL